MSYLINGIPLSNYGFEAGWITSGSKPDSSYALSGAFSFPKRVGKTYHDWNGDIEPYVDADDIEFEYRQFSLSVMTKAGSLSEFRERLAALYAALGDAFELKDVEFNMYYDVVFVQAEAEGYKNGWGMATLKLRESQRMCGSDIYELPMNDPPAPYGINGYAWEDMRFVVESIDGRYNMPQWQPLKVTDKNSNAGSRQPKTITISGTIKPNSIEELWGLYAALLWIICSSGLKKITYFDGSVFTAFCVDGFTIDGVRRLPDGTHWGQFKCKMIVI